MGARRGFGLVAVLLLAGCMTDRSEEPTPTDRARVDVLLAEPVVARDDDGGPEVVLGRYRSEQLGWERHEVQVGLAIPTATPDGVQAVVRDTVRVMRDAGWTVLHAACSPARPEADSAVLTDRTWEARFVRTADGVSYWARIDAELRSDGVAGAGIELRAPNERDPADLFTDRPPDLPATCLEAASPSTEAAEAGLPATLEPHWDPRDERTVLSR